MNSITFKTLFVGMFILLTVHNTVANETPVLTKPEMECERFNSLGWMPIGILRKPVLFLILHLKLVES